GSGHEHRPPRARPDAPRRLGGVRLCPRGRRRPDRARVGGGPGPCAARLVRRPDGPLRGARGAATPERVGAGGRAQPQRSDAPGRPPRGSRAPTAGGLSGRRARHPSRPHPGGRSRPAAHLARLRARHRRPLRASPGRRRGPGALRRARSDPRCRPRAV
ncbi:MAG: Transcriptional regulator, MarR family, partial [uncultured Thermomicrobiales bacterium]